MAWQHHSIQFLLVILLLSKVSLCWIPPQASLRVSALDLPALGTDPLSTSSSANDEATGRSDDRASASLTSKSFDAFVDFLLEKQESIIHQLEDLEASCQSDSKFTHDPWGIFTLSDPDRPHSSQSCSGGITRVIQGGKIIEKGACSLTLIQQGILSADRASTIRARQSTDVRAGDRYSAAALSMVLHTRSPFIPTFRSDVRIFMVESASAATEEGGDPAVKTWLGGGADLTPYYLSADDIRGFHICYRDLCRLHFQASNSADSDETSSISYESMKKACDDYFYLPARGEHRGTGGIFFDDLAMTPKTLAFTQGVVRTWMPSWIPIVERYKHCEFTDHEKQWQLLRRGRYLEFNLLYDRGVKFGLASANPRVEGVMVSAPPVIAFEYNHRIEPGSQEAELMDVLKNPVDWV
jgi:coproporphyrinogen III oxidase